MLFSLIYKCLTSPQVKEHLDNWTRCKRSYLAVEIFRNRGRTMKQTSILKMEENLVFPKLWIVPKKTRKHGLEWTSYQMLQNTNLCEIVRMDILAS